MEQPWLFGLQIIGRVIAWLVFAISGAWGSKCLIGWMERRYGFRTAIAVFTGIFMLFLYGFTVGAAYLYR